MCVWMWSGATGVQRAESPLQHAAPCSCSASPLLHPLPPFPSSLLYTQLRPPRASPTPALTGRPTGRKPAPEWPHPRPLPSTILNPEAHPGAPSHRPLQGPPPAPPPPPPLGTCSPCSQRSREEVSAAGARAPPRRATARAAAPRPECLQEAQRSSRDCWGEGPRLGWEEEGTGNEPALSQRLHYY